MDNTEKCFCHFNGYQVKDAYARATLEKNVQETELLKSRVDNFASLKDGSTTSDAELIDLRIGADGKQYNTAGNAVRGQFLKAMEACTAVIEECTAVKMLVVTATFDTPVDNPSGSSIIKNGYAELSAVDVATAINNGASVFLVDNDDIVYKYNGYRLEPNYSRAFFKAEIPGEKGITVYSATIDNEGHASRTEYTFEYGTPDAVLFTEQDLPPEQQARARNNIGAADAKAIYYETDNLLDFKTSGFWVNMGFDDSDQDYALRTAERIPVTGGSVLCSTMSGLSVDVLGADFMVRVREYDDAGEVVVAQTTFSTISNQTAVRKYTLNEATTKIDVLLTTNNWQIKISPEQFVEMNPLIYLGFNSSITADTIYRKYGSRIDDFGASVSEMENVRIGVDGVAYKSAGDAVRKQLGKLFAQSNIVPLRMIPGVYNIVGGVLTFSAHTKRISTPEDEFCVFPNSVKISVETGYKYEVIQCDADTHAVVKSYAWSTEPEVFPDGYAYKFSIAKVDDAVISEGESYKLIAVIDANPYAGEQKSIVRKVMCDKDSNTVTIVALTDSHYNTTKSKKRVIKHLDILNAIALKTGASFVVHLGDVIHEEDTKAENLTNLADYWSAQNNTPVPVLYTLAHHEQYGVLGVSGWANDPTACNRSECIGIYGQTSKHLGVVWSDTGASWYVDIKGTRFIGLDITDGAAGVFSDAVIAFLNNAVDGAEKVVVMSHIPSRAGVNDYSVSVHGMEAVEELLNNSGKTVAYIHGHTHFDNIFKPADIGFPYISICCALPEKASEEGFCSEGNPVVHDRVIGEYSEYCFDVFNIHTDTGEIRAFRFGAGADRVYTPA